MGIRMGSLSGLGPPCAAGGDDDGLGPASPGIAGSSGMFEAPYGDLPECFHISPEAQTHYPMEIQRAIHNVKFIHYHQMQQDKFDEVGDGLFRFVFPYTPFALPWRSSAPHPTAATN